jgi:dTDP-4-dehydrorhamnose 3,5-epimerase
MKKIPTTLFQINEYLLEPFMDHRGKYVEIFNEGLYGEDCRNISFVQDDISKSYKNVLRGLHGDAETWKLITCLHGEIYFVVLDARDDSPTKDRWQSFILNDQNYRQVLVPPGCANGHLVLSDSAIFHYKQSTYYSKNQFTVKWNDPKYKIWWPITNPILSRRDELGAYVD